MTTDPFGWHWCDTCGMQIPVIDEFDDQIGFEEQAREVHVVALDCGHDVVTPSHRKGTSA